MANRLFGDLALTAYPFADPYSNVTAEQLGMAADFTPVVGDVKAAVEAADYFKKGEYLNSALAGIGLIPFIPSMAGIMRGPYKASDALYHGSSSPINKLSDYSYNDLNIYGQGFYTTDRLETGKSYTKKGKGKEPSLYRVTQPDQVNFFDMEKPMSDEVKEIAKNIFGDEVDPEWIEKGSKRNLREVYDEFRDVADMSTDSVQEYFEAMRENLERLGYRGFEHKGGQITGKPAHTVRIYWFPTKDINIEKLVPEVIPSSRATIIE